MTSIFSGLITSKTRIQILMRLFFNPEQHAYLRELSDEFGMSTSMASEELQQLTKAGLLASKRTGKKIHYRANIAHPLFPELQSMVRKALGMDYVIESIIQRLGDLEQAMLVDDYAEGKDNGLIDLILIGKIDQDNLRDLVGKAEKYIGRKIRTLVMTGEEYREFVPKLAKRPQLLLWEKEITTENNPPLTGDNLIIEGYNKQR